MTLKPLFLGVMVALTLTACQKDGDAKPESAQSTQKESAPTDSTKVDTAQAGQPDLSAESAEYKKWVEGQIDLLLGDTQRQVN